MKIVNYPHPALRYPARPVTTIDAKLQKLAAEMLALMYEHKGLGLAAPQVAHPYQMFVVNISGDPEKKENELVLINPVILDRQGVMEGEEGCLSFPGLFTKIRRAKSVKMQGYNLKGELLEIDAVELLSRCLQHELDHLPGVLFVDKMGPIAKLAARTSLREFERLYEKARGKGEIPADAEIKKQLDELALLA